MKKRTAVRIIAFCAAAVVTAGGCFIRERERSEQYKLQLENQYSQALCGLNAGLNNISLILEKTGYVTTSAQISSMAAELYSEAELAKTALAQLPLNEVQLETVNRFLSQVGNYALTISKKLITGGTISPEQQNNLILLSNTAKTISQAIGDSQISFNNRDYWANELNEKLNNAVPGNTLADSLTELEENLTDYPTLIYDGPYSDHILTKTALMIQNAPDTDRDTALATAAKISGLTAGDLHYDGLDEGKITAYRFSNDSVTVTVSKNGGYAVYMRKNRAVGNNTLSYEQAADKAKRFLKDIITDSMLETYYYTDEGVCVINFAYLDGQTICYTDLIKIGVAMDTGEIMLYEASGYLFNHSERAFETPAYTVEQAQAVLNGELIVESSALALIPSDGGAEKRCYEFLCKGREEQEILIYVDAMTLEEEQIFILLKTDGGILTK